MPFDWESLPTRYLLVSGFPDAVSKLGEAATAEQSGGVFGVAADAEATHTIMVVATRHRKTPHRTTRLIRDSPNCWMHRGVDAPRRCTVCVGQPCHNRT